jgi:hypothetical protein
MWVMQAHTVPPLQVRANTAGALVAIVAAITDVAAWHELLFAAAADPQAADSGRGLA